MRKILILFVGYALQLPLAQAQREFPQYLFCVSSMGFETGLHEKKLDEYAMAELKAARNGWSFHVTVIENKLNSLNLQHEASLASAQSHSLHFPFNQLSLRLEVKNQLATVDCELRHERTLE